MTDRENEHTQNISHSNRTFQIIRGTVLIISMAFLGMASGGWISAKFIVAPGAGLSGGAEVVFYGLISAAIFVIISLIMLKRINSKLLSKITFSSAIIAIILATILTLRFEARQSENRDIDEAYEGVLPFMVGVEQIIVTDPYLRVKIDIDSKSRRWETTGPAPQHQLCRGTVRAKQLHAVSTALASFAKQKKSAYSKYDAGASGATQRVIWNIDKNDMLILGDDEMGLSGTIEFSEAQLNTEAVIRKLTTSITTAVNLQTSSVECD